MFTVTSHSEIFQANLILSIVKVSENSQTLSMCRFNKTSIYLTENRCFINKVYPVIVDYHI